MMMTILQQKELDLKITMGLLIAAFGILGLLNIYNAVINTESAIFLLVMAAIFTPIAIGLFFLKQQALVFAQFFLYLGIFVAIFGFINPFMASDLIAQGKEPPSTFRILLALSPYIIVAIWCLHIMGKYKSRFN